MNTIGEKKENINKASHGDTLEAAFDKMCPKLGAIFSCSQADLVKPFSSLDESSKNLVKTARLLATYEETPLNRDHVQQVFGVSKRRLSSS